MRLKNSARKQRLNQIHSKDMEVCMWCIDMDYGSNHDQEIQCISCHSKKTVNFLTNSIHSKAVSICTVPLTVNRGKPL